MFDPPSLDPIRSGLSVARRVRRKGRRLREVSASAPLAPVARHSGASHRGGASWSSATLQSPAASARSKSRLSERLT